VDLYVDTRMIYRWYLMFFWQIIKYNLDVSKRMLVFIFLFLGGFKKEKIYFKIDLKEINFYFMSNFNIPFVSNISEDIASCQNRIIKFIENYTRKNVKLFESQYIQHAFYMWLSMASKNSGKSQIAKLMADEKYEKNVYFELLKTIFRKSDHTAPVIALSIIEKLPFSETEIDEYLVLLQKLRNEFNSLLKSNGFLIFPSFPCVAPYHNQALFTNTIDHVIYFGIFNALGFPSTQIPIGLNKSDRLPIGIQLISNRYCDYLTIKLANLIEKELGGWIQP
jgi:fatty acid amide hydrolase 2